MATVVIGLGETGGPLYEVLKSGGLEYLYGGDIKTGLPEIQEAEVMHICIPYSENFVETVKLYQNRYKPKLTIIHSTVPIGTTSQLDHAVHSPILGKHGGMKDSIKAFIKWVGGPLSPQAADHMGKAGIRCKHVPTSEETEALKLLCLAKYGMSLVFADYCKSIADKYGFKYEDILDWDINYNNHVSENLKRPLIVPPDGRIGGHCVQQNSVLLQKQHPHPYVKEITKYERC